MLRALNELEYLKPDDSDNAEDRDQFKEARQSYESALYQVQSIIDLVEMCNPTTLRSGTLIDLVESGSQQDAKYLALKPLSRVIRPTIDYPTLVGSKRQAFARSTEILKSKLEQLTTLRYHQDKYLSSIIEVKKHSRLSREGNRLFAELGRGKFKEFAPDTLEILKDSESETGIKLVVPKLLSETCPLEIYVSSSLFQEWPLFDIEQSNEVLDALHKTQDLTMMKMMLMDIKRCDEYTVHSIHSDEFTLSLNTNHPNLDLTLRVGLKALDGKSILAKSLLNKIFQKHLSENGGFAGQPGLLKKFVESVAHLEVKSQVYKLLIQELETIELEYTFKKEHRSPTCIRFSVIGKKKLIDVEIENTTVRCCAYCSPYLNRTFFALRPMVSVSVWDIPVFLRSAYRAQR
eukprot:CAMPEP_0204904202 /NCGR_PEP_ID=MMETSP1397-20131031/4727_1 /ASSEMBLY_ACC=CAM_ASM_000891 /TAXON_ID=49980 /ORGANISM="Climacostomum Climacostomum virens, Strain Stock W-24" /LENGTH=403 /DNA_ID=CAMNT_0052072961 /DNA_START=985 /DNA_END=2196 /DNA_ORIENTATION=-